eukprot:COSAG06_NODE_13072_length_1296_cov_3.030075_1_plen_24_part_01
MVIAWRHAKVALGSARLLWLPMRS